MGILRKNDINAIKELDEDIKIITKKVESCDKSIAGEFFWFGERRRWYEDRKELEHETADDY